MKWQLTPPQGPLEEEEIGETTQALRIGWHGRLRWRTAPAGPATRSRGLHRHVVLLVLVALLPVGIVSAAMVSDSLLQARSAYRVRLVDRSRAAAMALDREIQTISVALTVLSGAKALDGDDTQDSAAFAIRLYAVEMALGHRLVLHPVQGGTASGVSPVLLGLLASEKRIIITGLHGSEAPSVYAPVLRDRRLVAVLDMQVQPAQISGALAEQNRNHGTTAVAVDADMQVVGSAGPGAPAPGTRLPDWVIADRSPIGRDLGGLAEGPWLDGAAQVCAGSVPDRAPAWTVLVCEPRAHYDAPWKWPLLARAAMAVASLGLGLLMAVVLARRLVKPLTGLTAHARAVAAGTERPGPVAHSSVAEFETLRQSLHSAESVLLRRAVEERRATREAHTSRQILASVLEGAAEGIHVKDLDDRYVVINRAALALLHLTDDASTVIGRTVADLHPEDVAIRIAAADREVIATGETRLLDALLWDADGASRLFAQTKSPWQDEDGRIVGVVTVLHDVTDARAAEARLRALQAELLRATRLSAMGAMATGLAHEVNQPLAASTNFLNAAVRLLDRAQAGEADALATARVAVAEAAAEMLRSGAIVKRLQHFVSRGEVELQPVDVNALIAEACDLARADGATEGVTLMTRMAPDTGVALMDRTQMQQVLLNLVRNAAEAIQCMVPIPGRLAGVTVSACRTEKGVEIVVADGGPGLAPEVMDRLFEPFVSTKLTGMGIGLTICRTIVEGHGGRLTGGNEPEAGGAVFRILLPLVPRLSMLPALHCKTQDA